MNMKPQTRIALTLMLMTATADAMAQGSPRRVVYFLGGAVVGGLLGFLLGLWWCRRCNDKKKLDKPDHPNDR